MSLQLENETRAAYERIPAENRAKMGGCIGSLPDAEHLQVYLASSREAWSAGWCNQPGRYPHLLLRLYHCVAFLRYEGNAFWSSFGEAVDDFRISSAPHRQTEINNVFDHIARHLGLEVVIGIDGARHCVQSSVRHVGIPVRVWRGFVEVCERLFFEPEDWKQWDDFRFRDTLCLWLGGRKNLLNFFLENRTTASQWVDEMLEARRVLEKHPDWTLDDIAQISRLRQEYFDEVPETALFLRPIKTETLFLDRPRLCLSEQPGVLSLHLETPRLKDESMLPSEWHSLDQRVKASTNPVRIPIHRAAFSPDLRLKLVRDEKELAAYRLPGLSPWGLWSESSGAFVSLQARELPVGAYILISKTRLGFANRDGWLGDDEDETRWNSEMHMPDGPTCFVSRLVPDGRRATLEVEGWHRIAFAPRARLELRIFPRPTESFFLTFTPPNSIALPAWPRFVLKTPRGLLAATANQAEVLLEEEFRFMAGEHRVAGKWIHDEDTSRHLGDEDVFFYKIQDDWAPPARRARPARVVTEFRNVGLVAQPVATALDLSFQLRSVRHGTIPFGDSSDICFRKEPPLNETHAEKLRVPFRKYWPWFLLTATQDHATWEEIRLAFDMMSVTDTTVSGYHFQVIEKHGLMVRRGSRWTDFQNRIHFAPHERGRYPVRYSGLTDAIFSVLRKVEVPEHVVACWERGHPPYLEMRFFSRAGPYQHLRDACQSPRFRIMKDSLWTH